MKDSELELTFSDPYNVDKEGEKIQNIILLSVLVLGKTGNMERHFFFFLKVVWENRNKGSQFGYVHYKVVEVVCKEIQIRDISA